MKQFRILFLALILVSFDAAATNQKKCETKFKAKHCLTEITVQQVITYLENTGHRVLTTPETEDGGYTWTCKTNIGDGHTYLTTVYTDGTNIIEFTDVMID
jgi:hypothetical protein